MYRIPDKNFLIGDETGFGCTNIRRDNGVFVVHEGQCCLLLSWDSLSHRRHTSHVQVRPATTLSNYQTANMPTNFHQFTHLPPELRILIWEYTLPEPRVFDIYPASTSQKTPAQQGLRFRSHLTEQPPATSAVCRESRSYILRHYSPLTLGSTTKYVDLSRDLLLLESCLFERGLLRTLWFMSGIPQIRDHLRSLAFGTSWGVLSGIGHPLLGRKPGQSSAGRFLQRLALFPKLERVVFVLYQEVQFEVQKLPRTGGAWDGHLSQNATLYLAGTKPPPVRSILPRMTLAESSLRPGGPPRPSTSTSCSVPWTDDKPSLPHVNELLYYSLDLRGDDHRVQRMEEIYPDGRRGPWPTTEDFQRFKWDLKRAIDAGVEKLFVHGTGSAAKCEKRRRKLYGLDGEGGQPWGEMRRRSITVTKHAQFKVPRMEGACLLWRFTLPGCHSSVGSYSHSGGLLRAPCSPDPEQDGSQCVH